MVGLGGLGGYSRQEKREKPERQAEDVLDALQYILVLLLFQTSPTQVNGWLLQGTAFSRIGLEMDKNSKASNSLC